MTKKINLFNKKEIDENHILFQDPIEADLVHQFILEHIDFDLPGVIWTSIDSSFAEIWNNQLGVGRYFYCDEIEKSVTDDLLSKNIFFPEGYIRQIVKLMLEYIEKNGGFME